MGLLPIAQGIAGLGSLASGISAGNAQKDLLWQQKKQLQSQRKQYNTYVPGMLSNLNQMATTGNDAAGQAAYNQARNKIQSSYGGALNSIFKDNLNRGLGNSTFLANQQNAMMGRGLGELANFQTNQLIGQQGQRMQAYQQMAQLLGMSGPDMSGLAGQYGQQADNSFGMLGQLAALFGQQQAQGKAARPAGGGFLGGLGGVQYPGAGTSSYGVGFSPSVQMLNDNTDPYPPMGYNAAWRE